MSVLRPGHVLRCMLRGGYYRLATRTTWRLALQRLRWWLAPRYAMRRALAQARLIEAVRAARGKS